MGTWAGETILFHKKECIESQCLKAGETQLSGSQDPPGMLVMAAFIWEQSQDIGNFAGRILFQPWVPA